MARNIRAAPDVRELIRFHPRTRQTANQGHG